MCHCLSFIVFSKIGLNPNRKLTLPSKAPHLIHFMISYSKQDVSQKTLYNKYFSNTWFA